MANKEKENQEEAGFFAIIPATVRYDKSLPQGAKLLYGELTALTKKKGYGWARNEYFAELYDTSERTIIEWIGRLRDAGHISIYLEYFPNSKKIHRRYFSLPYHPNQKLPPVLAKAHLMVKKTSLPESPVVKKTSLLEDLVVKKTSLPSGEENSLVISTNSNNTKAAAADQSFQTPEKQPPEEAATAFSKEAVDKLKQHFAQIDKNLVFDRSFYPKILSFLSEHNLTFEYLSWMRGFCARKAPKSLSGYLFKVLCEPRYVDLYRNASRPSPEISVTCPVCGKVLDSKDTACPECDFKKIYWSDKKRIKEAKILYAMSPDVKKAYESELDLLNNENLPFFEKGRKIKILMGKYGLLQAD